MNAIEESKAGQITIDTVDGFFNKSLIEFNKARDRGLGRGLCLILISL